MLSVEDELRSLVALVWCMHNFTIGPHKEIQ